MGGEAVTGMEIPGNLPCRQGLLPEDLLGDRATPADGMEERVIGRCPVQGRSNGISSGLVGSATTQMDVCGLLFRFQVYI